MSVFIETSFGNLVIDLFYKEAPNCSLNFIKLCKIKYFNNCIFHSIQKGFLCQTGDPTGTGKGGSSLFGLLDQKQKYFKHGLLYELFLEGNEKLGHTKRGLVSMAALGGGGWQDQHQLIHGSQFFITFGEELEYLDKKCSVFGIVPEEDEESHETLDRIEEIIVDDQDRPIETLRILHTHILYDPFPDPDRLPIPDHSPLPHTETDDFLTVDLEELELLKQQEKELTFEEKEKIKREKEIQSKSLTLEVLGDLPSAALKPPENVLFVCQLNPVTKESDLELIFSRFGKIHSCEIIRDRQTHKSLCYGFIEFEEKESVERAYLKMQNVIIDKRRIKVDFSQSVAKYHDWVRSKQGSHRKRETSLADHLSVKRHRHH